MKKERIKKSKAYWYNMYAPNRIARKILARIIYRLADWRYGAKARGISRYEIRNGIGVAILTARQEYQFAQWHYWMRVKNRIYDVASLSLADKLVKKYGLDRA